MLNSPAMIQARQILDIVYPVGMVLMFNDGTDPNDKMHGQTWEKLPGGYALTTTNNTSGGDVSLTDAQNHKPGYSYQGGLPNITGSCSGNNWGHTHSDVSYSGALGMEKGSFDGSPTASEADSWKVTFDASKSSDRYGAYQSKKVSVVADHYAVVAWKRTS